jgi:hypothetical protein
MVRYLVFYAALFMTLIPRLTLADDVYTVIVKKQEVKKQSRWSLSDWLETKNKIRLMDMWLALHTPSPYEFYFGGNMQFANKNHGASYSGGQGHFGAFATIFGLEAQHEQSAARITNGIFHFRVFGFHNQTTNITLQGGLRLRSGSSEMLRSPFAGVSTTIYFSRFFGFDGTFRQIFTSNTTSGGYSITGKRYEANAFIDFKFLRIFGGYFHEQEFTSLASAQNQHPIRSGALGGARFYF